MRIIGHNKERGALRTLSEHDRVSQGYLFVGPESVGKSLCALEFACLLVGEPDFEPTEGQPHPLDVLIVRPERETKKGVTKEKSIGAEAVRDLLGFLSRYPVSGRYRVAIVEHAHRLSPTAQNALLKTLEEPNPTTAIILVTHDVGALLPTILSRLERRNFRFVPREDIEAAIALDGTDRIAPFFFTLGRPGMILQALREPAGFAETRDKLAALFRVSTLSASERLVLAERLAKDVPDAVRTLEWWLPGLHDQALRIGEPPRVKRFFALLEEVQTTLYLLRTTQSNARLLLDRFLLDV